MSARRERGTGSLKLRGRIWWAKYYSHNKPIEVSCETEDKKKASRFLRKKLAEVSEGTHVDTRNLKYDDLRESYILDYQTNKRKSLRHDREGKPRLDAVVRLDSFFTGFKASEIDAEVIRKFQAEEQSKGLSNGSINRSISALRRMFNLALEGGRLRSVPYFPMLKEAPARAGFFDQIEYTKLSAQLPDYLRLPLALGFYTGMRDAEVKGLRWSQVDLLEDAIHLRAGETKNDEGRTIPIVPALRALLVQQHAKRQAEFPYVCFRLDHGGHAVKLGSFRKAWIRACTRVGLGQMEPVIDSESGKPVLAKLRVDRPNAKLKVKMKYVGRIFHDLRRSAVRFLDRAHVSRRVAMGIVGHKSESMYRRYNIVDDADVKLAGSQFATYLESVSQKNGDNSGTMCTEMQQGDSVKN